MQLHNEGAEIFVPDGVSEEQALPRTTHLGIGAHPDDLEIMSYHGILAGFQHPENWYAGVIVTNGSGSPRDDLYADYSDEEMMVVRRQEQKKAAVVGEYSFVALLDYPSSAAKDPEETRVLEDLLNLFQAAQPQVVYTHNLADKHDTHVASALRVIQALRQLPEAQQPEKIYGCEVWRDLDWLNDEDKVALEVAAHENLAATLLGIFDSQVCGGKHYDLATLGRRQAHATYHSTHEVDVTTGLTFAMDLTPLIRDASLDPTAYVKEYIHRFEAEVEDRLGRLW